MGKKTEDGKIVCSVLDKLDPGEPFFVIRGADPYSQALVRRWMRHYTRKGTVSAEKIASAKALAKEMMYWQKREPD